MKLSQEYIYVYIFFAENILRGEKINKTEQVFVA